MRQNRVSIWQQGVKTICEILPLPDMGRGHTRPGFLPSAKDTFQQTLGVECSRLAGPLCKGTRL